MKPDSASESDASSSSEAGEYFRVRVCLERFFSDERARVLVCVRPRRRVRWLQRRVCAAFALPPVRLLCAGHLLPPAEPLAVLRPDDVVQVLPARAWSPSAVPARRRADMEPTGGDRNCTDFTESVNPRSLIVVSVGPANPLVKSVEPDTLFAESVEPATLFAESLGRATPVSSPEFEGDGDLAERKRRALSLLQQYCDAGEAPARRRRRPRKRRRAAPRPAPASPGGAAQPAVADDNAPPATADSDAQAPDYFANVLRNDQHSRPPRVIRPLEEDPVF